MVQTGRGGSESHIVEIATVEPGVEPPPRPGVGGAGVLADGGLDEPAGGRRRQPIGASPGSTLTGKSFVITAIIGNDWCAS